MDAYDGYVYQIVGDAFCVAFHSAGEALNAALRAQQLLQQEPWSPAPVRVRMGIHTGKAQPNQASAHIPYIGYTTQVMVQRVMSAGHGVRCCSPGPRMRWYEMISRRVLNCSISARGD